MAELIERELGVRVELVEGDRGEFTVRVDGEVVARKGWLGFPDDQKVLAAVRQRLRS